MEEAVSGISAARPGSPTQKRKLTSWLASRWVQTRRESWMLVLEQDWKDPRDPDAAPGKIARLIAKLIFFYLFRI